MNIWFLSRKITVKHVDVFPFSMMSLSLLNVSSIFACFRQIDKNCLTRPIHDNVCSLFFYTANCLHNNNNKMLNECFIEYSIRFYIIYCMNNSQRTTTTTKLLGFILFRVRTTKTSRPPRPIHKFIDTLLVVCVIVWIFTSNIRVEMWICWLCSIFRLSLFP